eukprot:8846334-Pyramimonas_sp.AAC.1
MRQPLRQPRLERDLQGVPRFPRGRRAGRSLRRGCSHRAHQPITVLPFRCRACDSLAPVVFQPDSLYISISLYSCASRVRTLAPVVPATSGNTASLLIVPTTARANTPTNHSRDPFACARCALTRETNEKTWTG